MTRVMAQGTFDILHPGHIHYLAESAALGDELYVVIARDSRVRERKELFMDEESRRQVVDALAMVDSAILGSEGNIFESVARVEPDIITIGHDQQHDPEDLAARLAEAGVPDIKVVRIGPYEGAGVTSSSDVKALIRRAGGDNVVTSDRRERD